MNIYNIFFECRSFGDFYQANAIVLDIIMNFALGNQLISNFWAFFLVFHNNFRWLVVMYKKIKHV